MDCKACRREIEWAAKGEEIRAEEARAHLASCPSCRAFRAERDALRELIASVEPVSAPPDFDWKLRARLAAENSTGPSRHLRLSLAPGIPAIALAALFVLLITAALYLKRGRSERLNPTPAVAALHTPAPDVSVKRDDNSGRPLKSSEGRDYSDATANAAKSLAVNRQRRGRGVQVKGSKAGGEAPSPAVASMARRAPLRSNDFSSGAAPVITLFAVPVRTPTQPVKVLLDEGSGALRTVALQPVTFGSQEILRRTSGSGDAPSRRARNAEEIW